MRHFHNYILSLSAAWLLMLLTACSTDEPLSSPLSFTDHAGVYATMPEPEVVNVGNGLQSRSTLHYDYVANVMRFNWENTADECIGVFGYNKIASSVKFTRELNQPTGAMIYNKFLPPEGVNPIKASQKYISYRPFDIVSGDNKNYNAVPVSLSGQTANGNPLLPEYYKAFYGTNLTDAEREDHYTAYQNSEKVASSHLGAYDYLSSGVETANTTGGITFTLNRSVVVTRFFLTSPAQEVFDSLQLVVNGPNQFIINGIMNLENGAIEAATNGTSTKQTLRFPSGGIDMRTPSETHPYYYKKGDDWTGYIVGYMMLAPIDLRDATSLNIYIFGHDSSNNKTVYRAASVDKPYLTRNMFYQWTSKNNDRAPITFEPVTIEQWSADVNYTNDDGKGTGAW